MCAFSPGSARALDDRMTGGHAAVTGGVCHSDGAPPCNGVHPDAAPRKAGGGCHRKRHSPAAPPRNGAHPGAPGAGWREVCLSQRNVRRAGCPRSRTSNARRTSYSHELLWSVRWRAMKKRRLRRLGEVDVSNGVAHRLSGGPNLLAYRAIASVRAIHGHRGSLRLTTRQRHRSVSLGETLDS